MSDPALALAALWRTGQTRRWRLMCPRRSLPFGAIVKVGDSPPEPCGRGERPLSGIRALDLTRVISGLVCGRTLAAYGADVMLVTGPQVPSMPALVMDTGLGKLSASLELRQADDADRLRQLVRGADLSCQSYRPAALARHGLSPDDLARIHPGIIYVTLSACGHTGPWQGRRGFETLIQLVTGMARQQGQSAGLDRHQHLPAQVVDHGTGYLAALGALMTLARRAREGGNYLVRVSLAQTGRWVDWLGWVDEPCPNVRITFGEIGIGWVPYVLAGRFYA